MSIPGGFTETYYSGNESAARIGIIIHATMRYRMIARLFIGTGL